ncbi:hypothetical protein NQ318_002733 [Aromia moschata]|uniref:Uncharacterized protein n=1 Tax=Aromia moschata TaxID=1265417 RepID=A0AAV8Y4T2_9CUCU|nr:hypothetical protein NQ318_002733 [Aromia moschata]
MYRAAGSFRGHFEEYTQENNTAKKKLKTGRSLRHFKFGIRHLNSSLKKGISAHKLKGDPLGKTQLPRREHRLQLLVDHVLVDEVVHVVQRPAAAVLRHPLPVLVEVDCGEALHLFVVAQPLVGLQRAVHLDDADIGPVEELLAQAVPGGRKALAVAAPGRIELHESVARLDATLEGLAGQLQYGAGGVVAVLLLLLLLLASAQHLVHVALQVLVAPAALMLVTYLAQLPPDECVI